jgi:hypothetical protein
MITRDTLEAAGEFIGRALALAGNSEGARKSWESRRRGVSRPLTSQMDGPFEGTVWRAVDSHRPGDAMLGNGMYVSSTREGAAVYGKDVRPFTVRLDRVLGTNSDTYERIHRQAEAGDAWLDGPAQAIADVAKAKGYDGIFGGEVFGLVIFDPTPDRVRPGEAERPAQTPLDGVEVGANVAAKYLPGAPVVPGRSPVMIPLQSVGGPNNGGYIVVREDHDDPGLLLVSTAALTPNLKHQGWGAKLYQRATAVAKALGYRGIVASSSQTADAKSFWNHAVARGHAKQNERGRLVME